MRTGPKGLIGLGLPAALRPHAPNKGVGVPARALRIGGVPVQINGHFILIGS